MIHYLKRDEKGDFLPNNDPENTSSDWIHISQANEEDILHLAHTYDFPVDYLTGAFDIDEISRYEKLGKQYDHTPGLIVLLYPLKMKSRLNLTEYVTRPLSIIMAEDTLITATHDTPEFLKSFMQVDDDKLNNFETADQFVLKASMHIASLFITYLKEINQSTDDLEVQLQSSSKSQYLFDLMELQKSLVFIDTALKSNHPVIDRLKELEDFTANPTDDELLRDV
ncbi:MAG: magnesium transporter CorA family protein, partial [Desemzia incerta]